jgi:hypothetical protein
MASWGYEVGEGKIVGGHNQFDWVGLQSHHQFQATVRAFFSAINANMKVLSF